MNKGWEIKKLGEVCEFDKAQGIHRGLPYVGLEHIESDTARFIGSTDPLPVKSSTFRFSCKHVLYGRLRPYLNKALAPDFEGHCSTEIFPLKPSRELSREYLLYWLLTDETCDRINATCTGSRMPRAQMNEVMGFDFPLPPLAEQQRIVGVLDEAFAGLATAQAHAAQNRQNARALFESHLQSVFTHRGKGWVEKRLGELCDIKHGYAFDGAEFSHSVSRERPIIITPGNFTEDATLSFTEKNTKRFTGTIPRDFRFYVGDLVVVMTDLSSKMKILGKPAFVESPNILHNQRVGRFVFLSNEVEKRFIYYFLRTQSYLKAIRLSSTGTMVKHTAPKRILATVLPFPSNHTEQQKVVAQLDALAAESQRLTRLYEKKQTALAALKKALLHQAFTGEL